MADEADKQERGRGIPAGAGQARAARLLRGRVDDPSPRLHGGGQGLGGIAGAAIVLPAVGFAVAPIFHRGKERWEAVGPLDDFVEDTYRQVVFTETEGIGDAGKTTAYVRKGSEQLGEEPERISSPSPTAAPTSAARCASSRRPATSSAPATAASTTSRASGSAGRRSARSTSFQTRIRGGQRRARPPLQRHLAAEAGPRPRPRRVHRRHLGIPLPAASLDLPTPEQLSG